jgi:hypothetical protein
MYTKSSVLDLDPLESKRVKMLKNEDYYSFDKLDS